jgi:AmmeMemoRadiSam system protein B
MMSEDIEVFPLETPALRRVEFIPAEVRGQPVVLVRDPMGIIDGTPAITMNPVVLVFLQLANGKTTCAQMAQKVALATGQVVPPTVFEQIAKQFDEVYLLQSERFREALSRKREEFTQASTRSSSMFRGDGADRLAMIKQLSDDLKRHASRDQAPPAKLDLPTGSVAGILAPHIDYQRGGPAYAWAYRALREHGIAAKTWIVLGTCHGPTSHRFVATRKPFETPLGTVETDTGILREIEEAFAGELYRDEFVHVTEHSIELQAVYLRHMFRDGTTPQMVPILVGSFEDFVESGTSPKSDPEVASFCTALRRVFEVHKDDVGIIGGVDLSHCGRQFGDEELNDAGREKEIEGGDRALLAAIESGDPEEFFNVVSRDGNIRNVCSVAAIYCVLEAMRGFARGRLLTYQQHNSEDRTCLVSFASVAFLRDHAETPRILLVPG